MDKVERDNTDEIIDDGNPVDANKEENEPQLTPMQKAEEKKKRRLFASIIVMQIFVAMQYLNVTSFFPIYVHDKFGEETINSTMTSIAMCSFELATILVAPLNSLLIPKLGKKNTISIGFLIGALATVGTGSLAFIPVQ